MDKKILAVHVTKSNFSFRTRAAMARCQAINIKKVVKPLFVEALFPEGKDGDWLQHIPHPLRRVPDPVPTSPRDSVGPITFPTNISIGDFPQF